MKEFKSPEIEVLRFRVEDIITSSLRDDEIDNPLYSSSKTTFDLPMTARLD